MDVPEGGLSAQSAVDLLPDGVVLADAEGRVRLVNDRAGRMLGIRPDEAVGRSLDAVLAVTNHAGVGWNACVQPYGGLVTRTGVPEQSWVLPTGDEVLVAARIHRSPARGPVSLVAVSLRSGRARARLDRERSDLVATVAHELRSPLTGVKGFVQALLNRWDRLNDEQKKLMLTTVHADSDRLSRLITELLDVARLDTGRLSMHPRPCNVGELTHRVIDSVRAGAPHRIEYVAPDDLPDMWADPDKYTQVLTNVLENAIRHGADPVTVTVDAARRPGRRTGRRLGRRHRTGGPATCVHEVLDHGTAGRVGSRALPRQRAGPRSGRHGHHRRRPRRRCPDRDDLAGVRRWS